MTAAIYFQSGYAFKPGARFKNTLDPNAVMKEILPLRDEDGVVDVEDVVDRARPTDSAMHDHFEWDDSIAADEWRKEQGRNLLRNIVPLIVNSRTEDEAPSTMRAFETMYAGTNDPVYAGKYKMVTVKYTADPVATPAKPKPATFAPMYPTTVRTPTRNGQTQAPAIELPEDDEPQQAIVIAPPPAVLLTPERERALSTLRRWADAYGDDPYFAGVVAAIRALG